jgi:hypothetical protein
VLQAFKWPDDVRRTVAVRMRSVSYFVSFFFFFFFLVGNLIMESQGNDIQLIGS